MPADKRNQPRTLNGNATTPMTLEEFTGRGYGDYNALLNQSQLTVDTEGAIEFRNFTITKRGLENVNEKATEQQWLDLLTRLLKLSERALLVVGDLLVFGEAKWGKTYKDVAALTGYSKRTLYNAKYTTKQVQLYLRSDNLTYSHYYLVAAMDSKAQSYWLGLASRGDWSVAQLRKAIAGNKPTPLSPVVDPESTKTFAQSARKLAKYASGVGGFTDDEIRAAIEQQRQWLDNLERNL